MAARNLRAQHERRCVGMFMYSKSMHMQGSRKIPSTMQQHTRIVETFNVVPAAVRYMPNKLPPCTCSCGAQVKFIEAPSAGPETQVPSGLRLPRVLGVVRKPQAGTQRGVGALQCHPEGLLIAPGISVVCIKPVQAKQKIKTLEVVASCVTLGAPSAQHTAID